MNPKNSVILWKILKFRQHGEAQMWIAPFPDSCGDSRLWHRSSSALSLGVVGCMRFSLWVSVLMRANGWKASKAILRASSHEFGWPSSSLQTGNKSKRRRAPKSNFREIPDSYPSYQFDFTRFIASECSCWDSFNYCGGWAETLTGLLCIDENSLSMVHICNVAPTNDERSEADSFHIA